MRIRIVAVIVAIILAISGAVVLLRYVATADERAQAKIETVAVLVVTAPISKGAQAELGKSVELKKLPRVALGDGVAKSFSEIEGKVAAIDLVVGEPVLTARFVDPLSLTTDEVKIPDNLVQVTVTLSIDRVLGGYLSAGNTVGVLLSASQPEPSTKAILHDVLVARVQAATTQADDTRNETSPTSKPRPTTGIVLVTFATTTSNAERIVWGAEHGTLWLTLERATSDKTGHPAPLNADRAFK